MPDRIVIPKSFSADIGVRVTDEASVTLKKINDYLYNIQKNAAASQDALNKMASVSFDKLNQSLKSGLGKKSLQIPVELKVNKTSQRSWATQIRSALKEVNKNNSFQVQVSQIKVSASALNGFKKQLNDVINTLSLGKGTSVTLSAKSIGDITSEAKKSTSKKSVFDSRVAADVEALNGAIRRLGSAFTDIDKAMHGVGASVSGDIEKIKTEVEDARVKYVALKEEIKNLDATGDSGERRKELEAQIVALESVIQKNRALVITEQDKEKWTTQCTNAAKSYQTTIDRITREEEAWTMAATGRSKESYAELNKIKEKLIDIRNQMEALSRENPNSSEFKRLEEEAKRYSQELKRVEGNIAGVDEKHKSLGDRINNLASKFGVWFSVSQVIMGVVRSMRQMISVAVELDSAMAQLRIVTQSSDAAYKEYMKTVSATATEIGASIKDLIDATTTYARLGYSLEESSALAEYTTMLQNVGDIGPEDAQNAITAIVKAFDVDVSNIESIMDKLVVTGNNFPISVSQIAEGMNNASSALAAAGNTFEQSVALLTAANTTVQNAAKSSTAMRTIAARIRKTKTELDELGEDMSEATYDKLVSALTGHGVSLTDMNNEFRSTYDIIKDIADIWDELSSMEQAGLAEAIAGTRQQSIFYSLVEQFQEASGAMEAMEDSSGALKTAYGEFMESISAHINQFKAAFQTLAQNTFTRDFLNTFIDLGTILVKVVDSLAKMMGYLGGFKTFLPLLGSIVALLKGDAIGKLISGKFKGALDIFKEIGSIVGKEFGGIGKAAKSVTDAFDETGEAIIEFNANAGQALPGVTAKAASGLSTLAKAATAAFAAFAAFSLVKGIIDSIRSAARASAQESLNDANASVDKMNSLREAYTEYTTYASKVNRTEEEETKLAGAVERVNEVLGEKANILQGLKSDTDKYAESVKRLTEEELNNARISAKEAVHNAGRVVQNSDFKYTASVDIGAGSSAAAARMAQNILGNNASVSGVSGNMISMAPSGESIEDRYAYYNKLLQLQKELAKADLFGPMYDKVSDLISGMQEGMDGYGDAVLQLLDYNHMIEDGIPTTVDAFRDYRDSLMEEMADISGLDIGSDLLTNMVDSYLKNAGFSDYLDQIAVSSVDASGSIQVYRAALSDLSETLDSLKSAYDLATTAENEMAAGGGLSAETIKSLAAADKDYLDYLYEENGVVKLNTDAWKENANTKSGMSSDIDNIQREIDSLKEANEVLLARRDILAQEAQEAGVKNNRDWYEALTAEIEELDAAIEANNGSIERNQALLATYGALYGSITGNLDAYTNALNGLSSIKTTIDTVSSSMTNLANIQNQVANGFTMSLDKAMEFAAVYPEILNNATVAADGQITLNQQVVNELIANKQDEINATIDAQIAELEAKRAALVAMKTAAEAQLEMAKSVAEGEADISLSEAQYKIDLVNAATQAFIDAGMDEAAAHKQALEVMGMNEDEFNALVAEVAENMDYNMRAAAQSSANAVNANANSMRSALASIALQAQNAALAVSGVGSGTVKGSAANVGGGAGGVDTGGFRKKVQTKGFTGTDFNYNSKTLDLDNYIADIELDLKGFDSAIATIDGQIAALEALRSRPLSSLGSGSGGSGGGGGGGGGGSDAAKEVEEYIADIDEYYKALKRLEAIGLRVDEVQSKIDLSENNREKVALSKTLVDIYQDQAEALEDLNKLRSDTIANNVEELKQLGFQVQYNAQANELYIDNMEHLNELRGATQEETNNLRQETEKLINAMEDLNKSNQEGASSLRSLKNEVKSAKQAIIDYLNDIVKMASDVVDSFQNVYDVLHDAADEYAEKGYITIDTLQTLIGLGAQYMQYLMDENGLLVINHERIDKVLAAKTQELALEQALTYVERLRLAMEEGAIEDLNQLLYATVSTTDATWGLVYANLALLGLDEQQYQAALHNINALRSLADSAISSIGHIAEETTEELNDMKKGLDDILKYVMDMLKQRIQDQIDALEEMKDAYGEIIDLRKEALDVAKEEADYDKNIAKKIQEIAKLQARINALSLDDSRETQAQRLKLEEEMAELQESLADTQADHAREAQKEALDDMKEAYDKEKDAEIQTLEKSISSYQKLYDMAIDYIQNHWDTLYSELIAWNTEYGSVLNSEITEAWNNCLAAAQRYGSYVSALNSIDADISAAGSSGYNDVVGKTTYDNTYSPEEMIHAIIKEMYANSQAWASANEDKRNKLSNRNLVLGAQLANYGVNAVRGRDGVWYIGSVGGQKLFEKYKNYLYHRGGIAGDQATLKQNEVLAVLEKGEAILDAKKEEGLYKLVDFATNVSKKFTDALSSINFGKLFNSMTGGRGKVGALAQIAEQGATNIHFGDVVIYGANDSTVEKHREVNRQFVNEVIKQLSIKR